MKVSEVVKSLNGLRDEVGDVEVEIFMDSVDGTKYRTESIDEIDILIGLNKLAIYIAHRHQERR